MVQLNILVLVCAQRYNMIKLPRVIHMNTHKWLYNWYKLNKLYGFYQCLFLGFDIVCRSSLYISLKSMIISK